MRRNVVEFVLGADDLSVIRFGVSPGHELAHAVRVLQSPGSHPLQWGWLRAVGDSLPEASFGVLRTVVAASGYFPDFLTTAPSWDLTPDGELAALRAVGADQVVADLTKLVARSTGDRRELLRRMVADPLRSRDRIAAAWEELWAAVLAPYWDQLRRLLTADIGLQTRRIGTGGIGGMVGVLHETVRWVDGVVQVGLRQHGELVRCEGRGLLLVPSVLGTPGCAVVTEKPSPPTLFYPAHGVTESWTGAGGTAYDGLARLMGPGRAGVLLALDGPCSTSEVALTCSLAVSTASHHLAALHAARLVERRRQGTTVLHTRSPLGDALCAPGEWP